LPKFKALAKLYGKALFVFRKKRPFNGVFPFARQTNQIIFVNMLPGKFYHVFNHANGSENLFTETRNYHFFLKKLRYHISPVCRLYCYCLLPNHFHLLVSVREREVLQDLWAKPGQKLSQQEIELKVSKSFSNFFSCYAQAFNKVYRRRGSLFIPSMKCTEIKDDWHFCKAVHYIHANPVHHGFTGDIVSWPYSSYRHLLFGCETFLERHYVFEMLQHKKVLPVFINNQSG